MKAVQWLAALVAATVISAQPAEAQKAYPDKPVRIVVPFAAGGGVDILTRIMGQYLTERLGQQVIVDNRPGAGGNLGTDGVAKSPPDGYTLVMGTTGTHTINPGLYPKLPYDAVKDFRPITLTASVPNLLVVNPELPVKSARELIELAKASPGKLNFGSFGNGTSNHLSGELLKSVAQIDVVHVPYKNAPQAVIDLMTGQISFAFINMPLALPHVQGGKLRALAVTGAKRSTAAPEFPTMAEAGVPGFVVESWYGLLAPAGTPDAIIERLHRDVVAVLAKPEVQSAFAQQGAEPMTSTPAEFATLIVEGKKQWAEIIRISGAQLD
jgi:tripartite-type tricarboxylate transporter receptor subunit TctC